MDDASCSHTLDAQERSADMVALWMMCFHDIGIVAGPLTSCQVFVGKLDVQ